MRFCWICDWTFIQTSTAFCGGSCILPPDECSAADYADLEEVEENTMTVRGRFIKWDSNQANQEQACTKWGLSNQQEQLRPTTVTSTHLNRGVFFRFGCLSNIHESSFSICVDQYRERNQSDLQSIDQMKHQRRSAQKKWRLNSSIIILKWSKVSIKLLSLSTKTQFDDDVKQRRIMGVFSNKSWVFVWHFSAEMLQITSLNMKD